MKKFFRKIVAFLGNLFINLDEWIHEHVQPSIEMVERIKRIVASPVGDLITALIPGDFDDKLREMAITQLTKAIDALHVTGDIVQEPDWTNKAAKLLDYLRSQSKPMRSAIYSQLAVELSKQSGLAKQIQDAVDEGKNPDDVKLEVKGHSIALLTAMQYSKMKENATADQLPEVDKFLPAPVVVAEQAPGPDNNNSQQ